MCSILDIIEDMVTKSYARDVTFRLTFFFFFFFYKDLANEQRKSNEFHLLNRFCVGEHWCLGLMAKITAFDLYREYVLFSTFRSVLHYAPLKRKAV